jgi:hypothetical protein
VTQFSQAGEGDFLSSLLAYGLPLAGWLPQTAEGFFDLFQQKHAEYWNKAEEAYQAKSGKSVPEGSLLVVEAPPGRIHKIDFQTGRIVQSPRYIEADGTNAAQFLKDAELQMNRLRISGPGDCLKLCFSGLANSHFR